MFINKNIELIIIYIIIGVFLYLNKYRCPCNTSDDKKSILCYRYEIYGVQLNHILLYMFLGFFYSEYFISLQFIGILWELFEIYLDKNEDIAFNFGGCLKIDKYNIRNLVGKGELKYLNPIDKYFNIKNSKIHTWHGSIAEIFANIFGFIIGYILYRIIK